MAGATFSAASTLFDNDSLQEESRRSFATRQANTIYILASGHVCRRYAFTVQVPVGTQGLSGARLDLH